ncbi:MAG: hypothetical protein B7Y95_16220 [Rhizobiales bacterium 32-66-11]|jgi:hypothetical protein|nr:MAG: hypothetical protein B7Y95_16220 [Rhizobiales bacterium 32-66-11]
MPNQTIEIDAVTKVTLAALLNLIRLLGAELVAGKHRDDVDHLERALRAKLNFVRDGVDKDDAEAGLALAHQLLTPVLRQIRAQAHLAGGEAQPLSSEAAGATAAAMPVVKAGQAKLSSARATRAKRASMN